MVRHLITSALPYINGDKHLGNLVGSMLPADVYARFLRASGREVLFICATDEHGTPAELAAAEAGLDVAEFCRRQHDVLADVTSRFELSFDHFGRSSSPQNRELTQQFARQLDAAGYIEERVTSQLFSIADDRFLPDRYVVGTCPHCGYPRARGDQCENCTRVLQPTDLIEPRSAISGSTDLEVRESRHLFLLQSKLVDEVRPWLEAKTDWPVLSRSIGLKWLDEGLQDRAITRDLKWGVPVDRPGFEDKVFYVWFDAPIEYLGATWEWAEAHGDAAAWEGWWRNADDVRYTQFMAKDNVPFHAIMFPATVIGTGEPWKLVDYLKGFNWLLYEGGKFSTTDRIGVSMTDALDLLPADYWRYFLIANAPESDDANFSWDSFAGTINKDLAGTLGNFVNRTLSFSSRHFDLLVPDGGEHGEIEAELQRDLDAGIARYTAELEAMEYRKAMRELKALWTIGNVYLERTEPWKSAKTDLVATAQTLRTAMNLAVLFARLSVPVIPISAARILDAMAVPADQRHWPTTAELDLLVPGSSYVIPELLFRKISAEDVEEWRTTFGGAPAA
ncbi:methionine--tRNA ligase [soil metagenome]